MKKILTPIFLFVAILFFLSMGNMVVAQQGLGTGDFVVAPHIRGNEAVRSWLLYTARPGDIIRDSIDVWNLTEEVLTFSIRGIDATLTSDDGFALRNDDNLKYYLGKWISLSETKVTLNPKEQKEIFVNIQVPSESMEQDYWGGVVVTTLRDSDGISSVGWRIGIRTLVRVSKSVSKPALLPQANEGGSYDFVSALRPFAMEYEQKDLEMRAQMPSSTEENQTAENAQANILENEQTSSYTVFLIVVAVFMGLFILGAFGGKKVRIARKPPSSLMFFLVGILSVSTFFLNTLVSKAEEGGISILPYVLNEAGEEINQSWFILRLAAGEEKALQVKVRNLYDRPVKAWVYAVDSTVTTDGGFALQPETYEDKDVGAWITLAQSEVELAAQEMKIVDLTIRIPDTVEMGEHAGGLIIQEIAERAELENSGFYIVTRTGLRVYVTIPGEQVFKITSSSLNFGRIGESKDSRGFLLALANNGNMRVNPRITVEIRNLFGKVVDTIEYNIAEIFPGKSAELRIPWQNLKAGFYKGKVNIQYGQGQSSTEETSFTIAPQGKTLVYLGAGFVGVIVLIIFFKMFFARFSLTLVTPKKSK